MHSQSKQQESNNRWSNNREWNARASRSGSAWRELLAAVTVVLATLGAAPGLGQDAPAESGGAAEAADTAERSADLVNIQTASEEELQSLPGIGPSKAAAIVTYRERRPFRSIREIMRVRGIGRATFRRLRPLITVGDS